MAIQYPVYRNTLTKEDMGIPDYADALNKGFNLMQNLYKSIYTPRNLENEAVKAEQYNQERKPYAENALRAFEAEIGGQEAVAGLNRENTLKQHILNQYLPEKIKAIKRAQQFKNDNPLLSMPGAAGQVGALVYLQKHPELLENNGMTQEQVDLSIPAENQSFIPSFNQKPSGIAGLNYSDLIKQSLLPNGTKGAAPTELIKNLDALREVEAGYYPGTGKTQRIETPEKQEYYANALKNMINKNQGENKTLETYRESQQRLKRWEDLTPETKSHLVAIGQGAGIRGDQVRNEIVAGKSFDDILYDHGVDPENPPEPVYELTRANQRALNEREYASREVKYLSNFIKNATRQYANKIKGYNFAQVKDALFRKNDEEQARFLAARALSPELINLRLVLGGAKSTVSAIHSMADKSMLNSKIFESLVTAKVWKRAQEIADQELMNAFGASKKGYGEVRRKNATQEPDITNVYESNMGKREPTIEEARAELARRRASRGQ